MFDEDYSPESRVIVRRDGDRYIADYLCELYELETRIYGTELTFKNDAAYRDCPNQDWCALMEDPFKDMDSTERKLTMYDDMLIESEEYFYKAGDSEYDEDYYSITTHYYLPEGSPRLNDPESLRYFDTVTVSDAEEQRRSALAAALAQQQKKKSKLLNPLDVFTILDAELLDMNRYSHGKAQTPQKHR